jgi:transcriptional regulator with XRE-family HTH domain
MAISEEVRRVADRFGPRLKELRTEAGLSQKHLAKLAGVSQPLVSAFETGEYLPGWDVAVALAYALGVPVGAFTIEAKKDQDSD